MPSYFQHFSSPINQIKPPDKFTYPFYYEPHSLSKLAAVELQNYLKTQKDFDHNFGLDASKTGMPIGKMFGVLVVENQQKEIGYIAAVSGKLAEKNIHKIFVPPVYNMLTKDSYFLKEEKVLNRLTQHLEDLESHADLRALKLEYKTQKEKAKVDLQDKKQGLKTGKLNRDLRRKKAQIDVSEAYYIIINEELNKESIEAKLFFRNVKRYWDHILNNLEIKMAEYTSTIKSLKKQRKEKSAALQHYLFQQYRFLNSKKEIKNLSQLFKENSEHSIPAGAGECAAPKLLQYAFLNDLKPIALAEFWWGQSPKKEIRKHRHYYPSCRGKCKPILSYMLKGIEMDTNPMLKNPALGKEIEIIFEDEHLLVVLKPEEFLSVPGIHVQDSVQTRIKKQFPNISGPVTVHRLDMATSGLLVLAKNKKAHKALQSQFINKTVKKRYTALLNGIVDGKYGTINLPIRGDRDDRPRQLVCFEHGKTAKTEWEIIEYKEGITKVYFYPITGRTHQLRVHASHSLGLNMPIIGDDLYGTKANRLYLHADTLEFAHPITKEKMSFHRAADFF